MMLKYIDIHTHTTKVGIDLIQIINLDLEQVCPEQGHYSYGIHPWAMDKADFQLSVQISSSKYEYT